VAPGKIKAACKEQPVARPRHERVEAGQVDGATDTASLNPYNPYSKVSR